MAWYRTGTLQVTNGSTTVTGTGTQFTLSKGRAGDNIVIAGIDNEIASVNSDISITLAVAFSGPTDTGITDWAIIPTQSRTAEMNDAVAELVSNTSALASHISIVDDTVVLDGDVTGNASTATKLATGRTISLTGDATGTSAAFDGSGNLSLAVILANSGATAGTYKCVTVDAKGRVTAGSNPTTLAGFGITDGITAASAASTYLPLAGGALRGTRWHLCYILRDIGGKWRGQLGQWSSLSGPRRQSILA